MSISGPRAPAGQGSTMPEQAEADPTFERKRIWAVAVVAAALMLEIIDGSVVNVAIPLFREGFGANTAQIEWISAGYAFFFGVLLIPGGRLGDIFGYRKMFMLGMIGFALASAGCGMAGDVNTLILMRMEQGATGAMMGPQVLAIVQVLYAPHERFKVMGIFGIVGGVAGLLGPIIGGALIQMDLFGLGWRPIFLINVPVVAVGLVLAWKYLPEGGAKDRPGLDLKGTLLVLPALAALLFPLIEGPALGWPLWVIIMPFAGVALLVWLAQHLRARDAVGGGVLMPPTLFRSTVFLTGVSMALAYQMVTGSLLIAVSVTLQGPLGMTPMETALLHLPFAAGAAVSIAVLGRRLLPILGRKLALIGVVGQCIGLLLMAIAIAGWGETPRYGFLLVGFGLCGCGMGLISAPLPAFAFAKVAPEHAGAASGVFRASQQIGLAFGVATLGGLFLAQSGPLIPPGPAFWQLVAIQIFILLGIAGLCFLLPRNVHRPPAVKAV